MKILQVCPKYYPSIGGVETHVQYISERLAKKHRVTVFTGDSSGKLAKGEEINGVLVRRFKTFSPCDAFHVSLEMLSELRKASPDVVHGHSYHAFPLYFSSFAKANKFVVTTHYHGHGHTLLRDLLIKFYRPFGKKILEAADKIIAVSTYEKELLLKDFGMDESKIVLIPNGIDLGEFNLLEKNLKDSKSILYVGRLEKYKGVQHIIQTLPLLDKDFHLEIVGKGPYKDMLVSLVNQLRLNERVRFHQDLARQELLCMYAKSGVFILLSRRESFSIVIAEALAARVPCIIANTSALTEWVDNKNCLSVDYPIDSTKLASLITTVEGRKVGDVKLWGWDRVVGELENVLA
jgi:glycosyltransferase involved in cell wall biosynthesis